MAPLRLDVVSENQGSRIRHLVLHFTAEPFDRSLALLTRADTGAVRAHYLVPDLNDPTFSGTSGRPLRLVAEDRRAWHAGRSFWAGETALNNSSIGIEIVNQSTCDHRLTVPLPGPEADRCHYLPFPEAQLVEVIALTQEILARHPDIPPERVLGHADIAPTRKVDPGPFFPWRRLHEAGVGPWYEANAFEAWRGWLQDTPLPLATRQAALAAWGFDLTPTGRLDVETRYALRAFQLHFRPEPLTYAFDEDTTAILFALLARYRPGALAELALPAPPPSLPEPLRDTDSPP
ncbi:MAG: N-acetylmuramoyl-L-alanine amidase [Pseudomonadota bacterium]|nr:N-acetylmuramoyl-L-alanine amidase [Pseudomonadota bacterium]